MDVTDVKIVAKKTVFQGYFHIDQYQIKHKRFEGGWSDEISREVFERGHAACCLLFDPDLNELVLIEQFRPGAYSALASRWFDSAIDSPWLIELVAGIIEDGEEAEDVVRRESVEESGCTIQDLELICKYMVSPGASSETALLYCGKIDASRAGGIHGLDHEGEDIRVFRCPVEDAFVMLDNGKFNNSAILIAMYWFRSNHARLRRQWVTDAK